MARVLLYTHRMRFGLVGILWMGGVGVYAASVTPVGVLPGGTGTATLIGLSANGQVAFGNSSGSNGFEAFRWTSSSGIVGLGDLPGGGFSSFALGANADGSRIVGRGTPSIARGFVWNSSGGMTQIQGISGGTSTSDRANAVSDDGTVIAGFSNSLAFGQRATRWTGSQLGVVLPDLDGGTAFSEALGISGDGTRAVGWSQSGAGREAAYWVGNAVFAIGDFPGNNVDAYANSASHDGSVIVGRGWDENSATGFVWTALTGMQRLGNTAIGNPAFNSEAFDVTADGSIVVGRAQMPDFSNAFIWTATTGLVSLRQTLINQGVDVSGWTFNDARAVSADGLTIAGNGIFNGVIQGYVARLNPYYVGLSGQLNLQNVAGSAEGHPIRIEFWQGSTLAHTVTSTVAQGGYRVIVPFTGSYRVKIAGAPFLRSSGPIVNLANGVVRNVNLSLRNGDADGSGEVDLTDIDLIVGSYLSTPSSPGWIASHDLDFSGEVDLSDVDIAIANYLEADE